MSDFLAAHQSKTELRACSEDGANVELSTHIIGSISASVVIGRVNRGEEYTVEFGDVGNEAISVLILDPVDTVGESDNRDAVSV